MAILTEEMRQQAIGLQGNPTTIEVEKGMIRRFCEAIGDNNPLWQETEEAKLGPYKGMVAPPGLFHTLMFVGHRPELPFELPLKRILDGGGEWEYLVPVTPGEKLTSVTRIADVTEREGGSGPMVFLVRETTWTNRRGEVVARSKGTTILR
jgi:acyl dehydratase